jgi:uncharacterized protein (TIGR03492 family)
MPSRLLVLSNGHGEDLIALRLIEALQRRRRTPLAVACLPLVGEGSAFQNAEGRGLLRRVGPRQELPSGGFSNQSVSGLIADLGAGLPRLSGGQWRWVRRWGRSGDPVLAVGDLLPLLLAWQSGAAFAFIGTPKSDLTWATPVPRGWGATPLADACHRAKGSEWDPWEWALMRSPRCRLVAVRDRLTARNLQRHGVAALAPGNPMMDALRAEPPPAWLAGQRRLVLLPGSRRPEAQRNLARLLEALPAQVAEPTTVLLPTGSLPTPAELEPLLVAGGFHPQAPPAGSGAAAAWVRGRLQLLIGPGRFATWAGWGEVGLATAGTATEQLVGLGIPALSLPGPGPQFQVGFARRQSRLLGGAVQPCHDAVELRQRLAALLADPDLRRRLGAIGRRRMGPPGGSERLAALIEARVLGGPAGPEARGG